MDLSLDTLSDLFQLFFRQASRLIRLHLPSDSGFTAGMLLPHRLRGREGVNEDFRFELELMADSAHHPLESLQGLPIMVTVLTASGRQRELCGVVTEVRSEGSDGGAAYYRIILEPATVALRHTRCSRLLFGQSDLDAVLLLLNEELQANPVIAQCFHIENRCRSSYPVREMISLVNESKWDAIRRLLARSGISYTYISSDKSSPASPQHTLVLFDNPAQLESCACGAVPFHRVAGFETRDAISSWHARRTLQPGRVSRRSWTGNTWSLRSPEEPGVQGQGSYGQGLASTLEDYRYEGGQEHTQDEDLATQAAGVASRAREQRALSYLGGGSVRDFQAGQRFTLTGHPLHPAQDFVLLSVELEARNNLPLGLQELLKLVSAEGPVYRNTFTCIPASSPVVPEALLAPDPGLLTGTVVGPERSEIHTEEGGRIKVQLHFARPQDHDGAGASGTEADSVWLRVLQFGSSRGVGSHFIPRVGDEVLVGPLNQDPDHLVVMGILPGGIRQPGRFSEVSSLPADCALSGYRSQEHGGYQGNQLLFDDTPRELRTQLASDHARSELNLGWITAPRQGGQASPRGQGFELRTDEFGALRAGRGLLISSEAQMEARGDLLEVRGMAGQLGSALSMAESLSSICEQAEVEPLGANPALRQAQDHLANTLRTPRQGGTREISVFRQPILALSSPSDILSATPANQILSAGENLHATVGEDANWAVGGRFVMAVKELISLFASKAGILMTAAKGAIRIEAQNGPISILGDQEVKVVSNSKGVHVDAKEEIVLTAGGCMIQLKGGVCKIVAPTAIEMHTATLRKLDSSTAEAELMKAPAPKGLYDEQFVLRDNHTNEPLAHAAYRVKLSDGQEIAGYTDAEGRTQRIHTGVGPKDLQFFLD
nr:type VI secretion system Vgr family protein [uncultured Holophaga sp.]